MTVLSVNKAVFPFQPALVQFWVIFTDKTQAGYF